MAITFDLSTLNLPAGTYSITVKAKASGYADSVESNAVSYVVAGETVQVSGTWYFNDVIGFPTRQITQLVNYESYIKDGELGHTTFYRMVVATYCLYYGSILTGGSFQAFYEGSGWHEGSLPAVREITFDGVQTVSKEFYDWLVANAEQTHKLLPIGTYVWNERIYDNSYYYINVEFVSNGETFAIVDSDMGDANSLLYNYGGSSYKTVYTANGGWVNDAYRTMVFKTNAMIDIEQYEFFMSDVTYKKTPEPV